MIEVIQCSFKTGNNSERYLIREGGVISVLKFTDNKETRLDCKYTPKLLSVDLDKYRVMNDGGWDHVYQYEFIDGVSLDRSVINRSLLEELFEMMAYFFKHDVIPADCHSSNILVTENGDFKFVDMGGLMAVGADGSYNVCSISPDDEPEEYASDDFYELLKRRNSAFIGLA